MKRAALVLTSVGIVALAVACGSARDTELFSPPGSSKLATEPTPSGSGLSSGGSATGAPTSSSGGSGGSSSGGSSSSSGGSSSGGSSSSSSSSSSGGSSSGGSSSGGSSSGGSSSGGSSSGGYTDPGIWCGQQKGGADVYCSPATQICCAERKNGDSDMRFSCIPAGPMACSVGTAIQCDDGADCPGGQVCCGIFDPTLGGYRSLQCQASCTTPPPFQSVRFCDPDAPVDECQSIGQSCEPSNGLPGYGICK